MRRGGRTTTAARAAWALLVLALVLPAASAAAPLDRPDDPVVLTGARTAAFQGIAPDELVAFRWAAGSWAQVPVQVDERKLVNLRSAYPTPFSCSGTSGGLCYAPTSMTPRLRYADAGTLVGADTDATLDADDEVVFMAKDAGTVPPTGTADPAGVRPDTGMEVEVGDSLDGGRGSVFLFRQAGGLDPGAGAHYVTYAFAPTLGAFPGAYRFAAGTNPETSTVVTPSYSRRFTDRWQESELRITRGTATGVDILDRTEAQFGPDECTRSGLTFSKGEGTFLVNKSGPVRAIRAFLGANSGPMTEKQQVFYAGREDDTVDLRVHIIPAILSFVDYSAAASGMTYRNNNNATGVTVNGSPDSPVAGPLTWDSVDGPQGALTNVYSSDTTVAASKFTSFYRDTTAPPSTPCQGDAAFYGASGPWINGVINSTDESAGGTERLTMTRNLLFGAPGAGVTGGPAAAARVAAPLTSTTRTFPADDVAPQTTDDVSTAWRSTAATVTLTVSDPGGAGGLRTYYSIGASPGPPSTRYDPANRPVLAAGERIRYFSVDRAGNAEADRMSAAVRLETTAPATTDDVPASWRKAPVPVTLTATDAEAGVTAVYYAKGADPGPPTTPYDPAAKPVLAHGERIRYFAVDGAGNAEAAHLSAAAKVDQARPATTDDVPAGWRRGPVAVTLNPTDTGGSAVARTLYAVGADPGVPSLVYDPAAKPVLQHGERIRYATVDGAGNVEADRTSVAAKVDADVPATTDDVPGEWRRGPVTATLTATDAGPSGGLRTYYAKDATPGAPTILYDPADRPVLTHGQRLRYSTVDAAGNVEESHTSAAVRIDATAPVSRDDVPSGWRAAPVTVTLTASDAGGSGLAGVRYEVGADPAEPAVGSPAYDAAAKPALSDGERIRYAAVDGAGNVEAVRTSGVAHVDAVAPVTTITQAPAAATGEAAPLFAFTAATPATFACSFDGAPWTPCESPLRPAALADGPHVFRVRAANRAGLVEGAPPAARFTVDTSIFQKELPQYDDLQPGPPAQDPPPVVVPRLDARAGATRDATGRTLLVVRGGRVTVGCAANVDVGPCAVQLRDAATGAALGAGAAAGAPVAPAVVRRLATRPTGIPATLVASASGLSSSLPVRLVADSTLTAGPLTRSATLPSPVRRALDALARAVPAARAVTCTAYTDDRGPSAKADAALARAQAATACRLLKASGMAAAWATSGAGRARPVATNRTPAGRAANRRLVVRVAF